MEADFERIADFLHEGLELAKSVQAKSGKLLKDFNRCVPFLTVSCSEPAERRAICLIPPRYTDMPCQKSPEAAFCVRC